jgi:hypothetical protein
VPLALAAVLRVAKARSPESRRRARPPPAVLHNRRRLGVLPVEFAMSSPSSRCDLRDKWGTLAPHTPRAAARRRAPPLAAGYRRRPHVRNTRAAGSPTDGPDLFAGR